MNKKLFVIAASIAALTFTASCSDDDSVSSVKPNDLPSSAGQIKSGTDADDALPQGYKISSVDSYDFSYDSNGKLIAINGVAIKDGVMKTSYSEYGEKSTTTIKISSNSKGLITGMTDIEEYSDEDCTEKLVSTTKYEYNSNNQISKAKTACKFEGKEDGEKYSGNYTVTTTFSYDGKKLTKMVTEGSGSEDGDKFKEKDVIKFNYSGSNATNNIFYQYTPVLAEVVSDISWDTNMNEPFAYLGMLGKASSMLPSSYSYDSEWTEDGEKDSESYTHNCGPYSFNSYGVLSYADYAYYYYTSNSNSPYGIKSFDAKQKKVTLHDRVQKLRTRIHVK